MIKYHKENYKLVVSGHAFFASPGKDIVCASVSTLVISNTNLLFTLDKKENFRYQIITEPSSFKLEIINPNDINTKIFENIIYYLGELARDYPKFIKEEKWLSYIYNYLHPKKE